MRVVFGWLNNDDEEMGIWPVGSETTYDEKETSQDHKVRHD